MDHGCTLVETLGNHVINTDANGTWFCVAWLIRKKKKKKEREGEEFCFLHIFE